MELRGLNDGDRKGMKNLYFYAKLVSQSHRYIENIEELKLNHYIDRSDVGEFWMNLDSDHITEY